MPSADASPAVPPVPLPPSSAVTTRFGPRTLYGFDARDPERGRGIGALLPPQKIAWGALLTLLVITAPLGLPLLVAGLRQLRDPRWRVRTLVAEAGRDGDDARTLLESALAIDPDSSVVQRAVALWDDRHLHLAAAARHYRQYLEGKPGDLPMQARYAAVCLRRGLVDEAITAFSAILRRAGLSADARASATAHLAYAMLCRERLAEAGALLESIPLPEAATLGPGERQCAYYRAVVRYLRGERERGIELMDRLCRLHPEYPELMWSALSMRGGSFHLLLPAGEALIPVAVPGTGRPVERVPATPLRCAACGAPREGGSARCAICRSVFPD